MTGYPIRRIALAALVVLLVTVITFILLRAIPGNVAVAILGPSGLRNPAELVAFNREYGFDKPWFDPQTGIMAKIERQVGGSTG